MKFTATIHKLGINPCVDVPGEIVHALLLEANKQYTPVQVKGTVNGKGPYETNVVKYQAVYRLYLNTKMRKETGVGVGDIVHIALEYDPGARIPPMPNALKEALNKNPRAKEKWRKWRLQPASRQ